MIVQWGCKGYIINDVLCQIPVFFASDWEADPNWRADFSAWCHQKSMYINTICIHIYIYIQYTTYIYIYTCGLSIHCNKRPRPGFHLGSIRLSPSQLFRCSEQSPWLAGDRSQLRAYNRSLTPLRIAWLDHGHRYRGGCFWSFTSWAS